MPIRPENRNRYPKNWKEISHNIRFERGGGRCECQGQCGIDHNNDPLSDGTGRCMAEHQKPHPRTGSNVILTCAHYHHAEIEDCGDNDLFGACQQCHNKYDAPMRAAGVKKRKDETMRKELEKQGQIDFETVYKGRENE